jgi:hypothetical protein
MGDQTATRKVKVKLPVFLLTEHHAMKVYGGVKV